jgi:predicted RNA binding protein YcfA (HicA-like mRNA interferase family)
MWYAPLYQDAANQSAIVQVVPAHADDVLPAGWHWGHAVTHEAPPPGKVLPPLPMIPVPAKPPTSCGLVIPVNSALARTIALPAAYRYSASKAVRYVAHQIGWRFIQQKGSVPMALVQIGMPWAPKTATAFSLLKRMADKDPGVVIAVNFVQKTITYKATI